MDITVITALIFMLWENYRITKENKRLIQNQKNYVDMLKQRDVDIL